MTVQTETSAPAFDAERAVADGVDLEEPGYEDYYGGADTDPQQWFFPDKKQYIQFEPMNEGGRARFQRATNKDVTLERNTGNARLKVDPATERHILLTTSITGWNLVQKNNRGQWAPVTFSKGTPGAELERWIERADPKLLDDLEFTIRKANPWMQADMTVEEIDKEIDRLTEMRAQVVAQQAGEGVSSGR